MRLLILVCSLSSILFLSGCAAPPGGYGVMTPNFQANVVVTPFYVPPRYFGGGHRYYHRGHRRFSIHQNHRRYFGGRQRHGRHRH